MSITSRQFRTHNQKAHTLILSYAQGQQVGHRVFFIDGPEERLKTLEIDSNHHLCSTCRRAFGYFAYYVSQHVGASKDDAGDEHAENHDLRACAPHHAILRLILISLEEGCHVCTLLYQKLSLLMPSMVTRTRIANKYGVEMCWLGKYNARDLVPLTGTVFQFSIVDLTTERSSDSVRKFAELNFWESNDMDLFLPPQSRDSCSETSSGDEETEKRIGSNTGSESSRQLAGKWLSSCFNNTDGRHAECNKRTIDWLPKRLLDVKSALKSGVVKLVTVQNAQDIAHTDRAYVTLSHCWGKWGQVVNGKCNLPILTSGNVQKRHKIGLPLDSLSKTFRDAVMVASWFDVRWLWIDSLCVLQDRLDDWRKTASAMSKIYTNALLNISADAASDARYGLFNERETSTVSPCVLSIPSLRCLFVIGPSQADLFSLVDEAPLACRAWVFQERQLASRVLHFTASQLLWECCGNNSSFASEMYPNGARLPAPLTFKRKYRHHKDQNAHQTWAELCDLYSELQLSRQSDKLAAIAGMGREVSRYLASSDQYVAGMWRKSLPEALLWSVKEDLTRAPQSTFRTDTVSSWSWASIVGPVESHSMEFNPLPEWRGSSIPIADVIDALVAGRPGSDGDGSMWMQGDVSLMVKGVLRPITWYRDPDDKEQSPLDVTCPHTRSYMEFTDDGVRVRPRPRNDYWTDGYSLLLDENDSNDTVEAFLLPIQISDTDSDEQWKSSIRCLILQKVPDRKDCFKRIGVGRFTKRPLDSLRYRMKKNWLGLDSEEVWRLLKADQSRGSAGAETEEQKTDSFAKLPASIGVPVQSWEQMYSTSLLFEDERHFERLTPQVIKLV